MTSQIFPGPPSASQPVRALVDIGAAALMGSDPTASRREIGGAYPRLLAPSGPRGASIDDSQPRGPGDVADPGSMRHGIRAGGSAPWAPNARPGLPPLLEQEETAHRTANLSQLIVSNLERTARSLEGPARQAIEVAAEQVGAVIRLQRLLTEASPDERPYGGHFRALVGMLDVLVLRPRGHLAMAEVDADAAEVPLSPGSARRLSQIIVELVMNAAKHAFTAGPGGRVHLTLSRAGGYLRCLVSDDGAGDAVAVDRPGSRGMALVDGLARHEGGRCRWVFRHDGAEVQILWPFVSTASSAPARCSLTSPL